MSLQKKVHKQVLGIVGTVCSAAIKSTETGVCPNTVKQ